MYAWIDENQGNASVAQCCRALDVRREGYYSWLKSPSRTQREEQLASTLRKIRQENPAYGVRRMRLTLPVDKRPSYGTVYNLCRNNGLLLKRRNPNSITKADPKAIASEDLVKQDFTADKPCEKALTDITEIQCVDGKLYLCVTFDCYDGAIIGYSMDDNMRTPLCTQAVMSALGRYGKMQGMIIHSDRGAQFTSHMYRQVLDAHGLRQSMGRRGTCYDNARMESFFATLKKELIYRIGANCLTREYIKQQVFVWIETYYNRTRLYSANEESLPPLMKREAGVNGRLAA